MNRQPTREIDVQAPLPIAFRYDLDKRSALSSLVPHIPTVEWRENLIVNASSVLENRRS